MRADEDKSQAELISELNQLREAHESLRREAAEQLASTIDACRARSETEEALQLANVIIDRSPVILFRREAGEAGQLVYVSENFRQLGYAPDEFISGKTHFKDIVHPDDGDRVRDEIMAFAERDVEEYTQVYRVVAPDGAVHWVEDQTSVVRDGEGTKQYNQGILIDFTERKQVEDALRKSEEKFRRIVETAGEGFLLMNEEGTIVEVNDACCRLFGFPREQIIGRRPTEFATPESRQYMRAHRNTLMAKDHRSFEGDIVNQAGQRVPVLIHGSTLRDDNGAVMGNMAFITDLTEQKKALALASEVQKSLLPHSKPVVKGFDVAGRNISSDEIGGDYFDFLWRRENPEAPFSIVVGDITGHGVDAALLMTSARAFLRMRALQPGDLAAVVADLNRHLTADTRQSHRFMTLLLMAVDPATATIEWVRAGHDPALLYDPAADAFEELRGPGLVLGLNEAVQYSAIRRTDVRPGQIIALGTDGIWEARNTHGEMWGKERLQDVIRARGGDSAGAIVDSVFDRLKAFTRGTLPEDDKTLVVVRFAA